MAAPDLTGLTSVVSDLNDNQLTTNELLKKLVEHFTEPEVEEPDEDAAGGTGPMTAFGRAALKTVAFLTAANAALLVFSRTLTKQAELLGGAVEREVATQMITRQMWGENFEGIGPDAFGKVLTTIVQDFGIVPEFDAATPGMRQMGELREEYGIDLSNLVDPIRMMMATGAVGSFNEAMDEIIKTREKLAGRGLNVNKALKEIRSLPDLVARFGSTASEELLNLIEHSQKLGISARALQDSVLGLAGKGFGPMVEEVANLQTLLPGLTIDFNQLAGIAAFGTGQEQLDFLGTTFEDIDLTGVSNPARLAIESMFSNLSWEDILKAAGQVPLGEAVTEITALTPEETFMSSANIFDKGAIAFNEAVTNFGALVGRMMGAPLVESLTKMLTVFGGLWAMFRVSRIVSPGGAGLGRTVKGIGGAVRGGLAGLGSMVGGLAGTAAGVTAATAGTALGGLALGGVVGEGINRLTGTRSIADMRRDRRERKQLEEFSDIRETRTRTEIERLGFSSDIELRQKNQEIQERITQTISSQPWLSYEEAVERVRGVDSGSVTAEPTGEVAAEQLINIQTVHEQVIETPGPVEEVMEAIAPTDEPRPADIIEQHKINTDSITSRLDTLLVATNNLNDTIREVEIAFPTEMKLGGDTVEFAGLVQRKAFDAVVRGS